MCYRERCKADDGSDSYRSNTISGINVDAGKSLNTTVEARDEGVP
jgi:hypothetical protein